VNQSDAAIDDRLGPLRHLEMNVTGRKHGHAGKVELVSRKPTLNRPLVFFDDFWVNHPKSTVCSLAVGPPKLETCKNTGGFSTFFCSG
jgi:hypothetical protein